MSFNKHALIAHVRLRPGMYIGGKDASALHELIYICTNHFMRLATAGKCSLISVSLRPHNEVSISSDDPGIPVEVVERKASTILELFLTTPFLRLNNVGEYIVHNSMFGGGFRAINALSAEFAAETKWNGYLWRQTYAAGQAQTDVIRVRPLEPGESTGTTITFKPDFTIFEPNEFDYDLLAERFQEIGYLMPGLTITVRDERVSPARENVYHYENGLLDYIAALNADKTALHPPISGSEQLSLPANYGEPYPVEVDFAFQYVDSAETTQRGYVNTVYTPAGTHLDGFRAALVDVINGYTELHEAERLTIDEILPGLTAVVSIRHPAPQFESQAHTKLLNRDAHDAVYKVAAQQIKSAFEQHPDIRDTILQKCLDNRT